MVASIPLPLSFAIKHRTNMSFPGLSAIALAASTALLLSIFIISVPAQTSDQPPSEQGKAAPSPAEAAKLEKKARADQAAEAGKALKGPAANPECVWLGERVVGLLWRDDLDTAFRHLELYDRFGCPGGHVQMTFRCVVLQGNIDPKASETLNSRVHTCWLDPEAVATAAPPPTPTAQSAPGTNPR